MAAHHSENRDFISRTALNQESAALMFVRLVYSHVVGRVRLTSKVQQMIVSIQFSEGRKGRGAFIAPPTRKKTRA
jgi:hypothetical protein